MSEIKTNGEDLIINADAVDRQIIFKSNGLIVGSVDSEGFKDEYGKVLRASLYPINSIDNISSTFGQIQLNCDEFDTFQLFLSNNCNFVFVNMVVGRVISIIITDGYDRVTWPEGMIWPEGEIPSLEEGISRVVIQKTADNLYMGSIAGIRYA